MLDLSNREFLDSLRDPLGTPCWRCGITDAHEHASMWQTPKRWAVRVNRYWQSSSGIWWTSVGTPRYFPTEEKARAVKDFHNRRVIDHDFHWNTGEA